MSLFRYQMLRGATASWATSTKVLLDGEPGLDQTTREIRIGDGKSRWSALKSAGSALAVNASVAGVNLILPNGMAPQVNVLSSDSVVTLPANAPVSRSVPTFETNGTLGIAALDSLGGGSTTPSFAQIAYGGGDTKFILNSDWTVEPIPVDGADPVVGTALQIVDVPITAGAGTGRSAKGIKALKDGLYFVDGMVNFITDAAGVQYDGVGLRYGYILNNGNVIRPFATYNAQRVAEAFEVHLGVGDVLTLADSARTKSAVQGYGTTSGETQLYVRYIGPVS
jgi:hypothetical protein